MQEHKAFIIKCQYGLCLSLVVVAGLQQSLFANPHFKETQEKIKGQKIYRELCLECHGDQGQGVKDLCDDPLHGNRSLESLVKRIERTMPEDDEDACVGPDAQAVATYIYDAFYSPQARSKLLSSIKPKLQRLTVPQYKSSVTDLITYFRKSQTRQYSQDRHLNMRISGKHPYKKKNDKKVWQSHKQKATEIEFSFSDQLSIENLDRKENIEINYEGSVLAESTGIHEFSIQTENGFSLWLNERDWKAKAQIDGSVVSGKEVREMSCKVYLMKGWAYPMRLKWNVTKKEEKASMKMFWKTPGGIKEPIPDRVLVPSLEPEVALITTAFPADDASQGYEMGISVSKAWQSAIVKGAIEAANHVSQNLFELARTKSSDTEQNKKIRSFCEKFVERALRRPLTPADQKRFVEEIFKKAENVEVAAKRVVLMTLCSAEFLYPEAGVTQPDDYDVASRLSMMLWDSLPDDQLLNAAAKKQLQTEKQVRQHARRMINDRRTRIKLSGFFDHWLELDRALQATKDEKVFPEFNSQLLSDLKVSLEMFLDHVVWSENSDYRELLTADYLYLNERLKKLYFGKGGDKNNKNTFEVVKVNGNRRSGVITHPYLLTSFAYHNSTSPIHRGVFLTRNIVGRQLKPPPKAISFSNVKFEPNLTMREKVTSFTKDNACMSCHALINPLGFSLENFDGIGRWRDKEKNKPIDVVSDFIDDDGEKMKLKGARDVAQFAIKSEAAQRGFIRQLFHHIVKQEPSAYGLNTLGELEKSFKKNNYNIKALMVEIVTLVAINRVDDKSMSIAPNPIQKG